MPEIYPIQQSFAAGEISPLMAARSDVEGYRAGCALMENFIPESHGPAVRRNGSRFVDSFNDTYGRILPFQMSQSESYIVVLTSLLLSVADELGVKASANDILNSDFESGSANWTNISGGSASVVFYDGYVQLTSGTGTGAGHDAAITQLVTLSGTVSNTHRLIFGAFDTGPMKIKIGTTSGGSEILESDELADTGTIDFIPGVANVYVTIFVAGPNNERTIDKIELREKLPATDKVEFVTPWGPDDIDKIQVAMPPDSLRMYFVHPNYQPYELVYTGPNTWAFNAISFTSPPAQWTGSNWPSVIEFFQGRLWLMSTPDEPETMWASQSGIFTDFTTGATAEKALKFTMSNKGRIEWAVGAKNFLIGTENGEYILTSQAGIIWAEDFGLIQQSAYGSMSHQPEKIGNEVVFITPDALKLRQLNYEFTADGWLSRDLTYVSNHITANRLKDVIFAQYPTNTIWMTDEAGNAIACSYDKTTGIIGWSRHVTQGKVLSMTVTQEFGISVVWGLVDRSGGSGTFCLERFYEGENIHYVDSFISVHSDTPVSVVTGLDHLEGQTVQIDIDGSVHPEQVVSSGQVTLDYAGYDIAVGLGYVSKITTLRPDQASAGISTTYPWEKRYSEIYVSLINSHIPKINGQRPPVRSPSTLMGVAEPAITDHIKIHDLGYGDGSIEIEQDLPISCVIGAIYGKMGISRL